MGFSYGLDLREQLRRQVRTRLFLRQDKSAGAPARREDVPPANRLLPVGSAGRGPTDRRRGAGPDLPRGPDLESPRAASLRAAVARPQQRGD